MQPSEFLHAVLPAKGYYIAATPFPIKGTTRTAWINHVCEDVFELQAKSREWVEQKRDVYFALASFAEKKVWNPAKIDFKTKKHGAWEKRTQANVKFVRSLFLDLDVKTERYGTQRDAFTALWGFCREVGLPKPTLVSSGYGIHVYWVLDADVPRMEWKATAEKLKTACVTFGLMVDHGVTADEARVLRVPGTTNFKRDAEAPVEIKMQGQPHALSVLDVALTQYLAANNAVATAPRVVPPLSARQGLPAGVKGNLGATNDPLNGNALVFLCPAMTKLAGDRGKTASYDTWLAGLSLARYCEPSLPITLAISDGYRNFSQQDVLDKIETLTGGPATCAKFWSQDNNTCEHCPHWKKITSPAEIARPYRDTAPKPINGVEVPTPPQPYMRIQQNDGSWHVISRERPDPEEEPVDYPVCPYDLYPVKIMEQENEETNESEECSTWIAVLPRSGAIEWKMPQSMLSDTRKLHAFLLSRGLHVHSKEAKATQLYMTAYLKSLAKEIDRERMFERIGWHDHHKSFVLPDVVFNRDGEEVPHTCSKTLDAVTKNALHVAGDLAAWKIAMSEMYGKPGYESYRTFTYFTWGGPLLHMTTQKGVLIAASGDTGRGKTTLLEACASIWGNPEGLLVGGGKYGATMNAMWTILGTFHSISMFWDDTTERDPDEMREFMLHISTGRGKERMHGNVHDGKVVTWETIVLSSANTDDVHRVMTTGKDSNPHLMRFISVDFDHIDRSTEAKLRADKFKHSIRANYGFGRTYLQYITKHYDEIQELVNKEMERYDRLLKISSEERHWSAALAVAYVGGRIAFKLGLTPFDPRDDEQWMLDHVGRMRLSYKQAQSSPADILNEFLEKNVPFTLILSPKQSSHVDNIVNRPHGPLYIRNEVDTGMIYVARTAINDYCTEVKANFRTLESELILAGVLTRRNCFKVLGADTPFAGGQTRCWELNRTVLSTLKGGKP